MAHWTLTTSCQITPSKELEWVPCFRDNFECARLELPMDYDNPESSQTVVIALTRLLATDRDDYRGSILVNPGGPGVSGTNSVWTLSPLLGTRVGRNYDVVGWDIRGSWRSTPTTNCWSNIQRRAVWRERFREHWQWPGMYDDPAFIGLLLAQMKLEKSTCKDLLGPTGILEHVNTAYHARDMNSIREALGEDKLNYWGVSWGTALGGYFASMFPSRVGRMVLDGNIDIRKRAHGDISADHGDFRMTLEYFFETCSEDARCAFHKPTAAAVRERYETLMDDIRMRPRVFNPWNLPGRTPVLTTYALANIIVTDALRAPLETFPQLAGWLTRWEANNDTTSEHLALGNSDAYPEFSNTVPWDANNPDYANDNDALTTRLESEEISNCADWPEQPTDPIELQTLLNESPSPRPAAMLEVGRKIWCAGSARPKWRYTGTECLAHHGR
ncbi:hypothetical protein SODALDRAFT_286406 [Sodiomyces alkalinus F11]|uniref:AB hydrolase-1 domain-containing protein n=1 Tax=Sodiomyces alkalinus (strain CBS 110278 / VKM F-3762 / F11) TaxID=1314773 RepID=A0A3N2PJ22_SODAK|nr:hypothetical protein SODALDRAFT_286406 [Sodiomyces alkalinus F11]ROT34538.1 hypothetical protein SODALDRAFT_286406 [Sodiomyces alkalinus F11]